jgi:hypothetical protein
LAVFPRCSLDPYDTDMGTDSKIFTLSPVRRSWLLDFLASWLLAFMPQRKLHKMQTDRSILRRLGR